MNVGNLTVKVKVQSVRFRIFVRGAALILRYVIYCGDVLSEEHRLVIVRRFKKRPKDEARRTRK